MLKKLCFQLKKTTAYLLANNQKEYCTKIHLNYVSNPFFYAPLMDCEWNGVVH